MEIKKLYVVNKFIMAKSAKEAVRIERQYEPDEVFLESEWKKANPIVTSSKNKLGFKTCSNGSPSKR